MTVFYAQPYDMSACGFYFSDMEEYDTKYLRCRNSFGGQIEEFENQGDISYFIDAIDEWEEYEKQALIIAVGECGYDFDLSDNVLQHIASSIPTLKTVPKADCSRYDNLRRARHDH